MGVAASGSREVSQTAVQLLETGGNAFDAALGALCTASVSEPLLASLGGGGFLLALPTADKPVVYDFFCQTPRHHRPADELDFYPIQADFGTATQEFHIGKGSMAVPGVVAGLFEAHRDLGRMPIREVMAPAIEIAKTGVPVDAFHSYIMTILQPILSATEASFELFESPDAPGHYLREGEILRNPTAANALEALSHEGPDLFYRGEWAEQLASDCKQSGGLLTRQDLDSYRVERRKPVVFRYRGARCAINPPPSPGGCLVAFALALMGDWADDDKRWGEPGHVLNLMRGMRAASLARHDFSLQNGLDQERMKAMLDPATIRSWQKSVDLNTLFSRGTTHISVADAQGNIASLTASNGEGCSYVLPGTGIMMNNMLGEEDLNFGGFHHWKGNTRLASMMSPAVLELADETRFALGSGGSNRIRGAMTQVLVNLLDLGMSLEEAVAAPRIHLEKDMLSIEPGYGEAAMDVMRATAPQIHLWPDENLFFGGVHAVSVTPGGEFHGVGDPRRGGEVAFAKGR